MSMVEVVDVTLLVLLAITGITIIRLRNLFAAVMLAGIYSLLSAGLFVVMDAVDVAFTEAAVGAGRSVESFVSFLEARARGGVPQNVIYTINSWAGAVTFATLERGVLIRTADEVALERILAFPEMEALVLRRLGPGEVLLKEAPTDRKLLAALRERGIELQGP